jgi:predicted site-specific integrase-resolvase
MAKPIVPPRLLTAEEVAQYLRVTVQSVHNYRKRGLLDGIRLGKKHIRFDPIEVARFVRDRTEVRHARNA